MASGYSTFFWRMSPSFDEFVLSCIYNLFYDFLVENTRSNFIKKTFCRNNISIFFALIHIHPNSLQKYAHIMRNRDFPPGAFCKQTFVPFCFSPLNIIKLCRFLEQFLTHKCIFLECFLVKKYSFMYHSISLSHKKKRHKTSIIRQSLLNLTFMYKPF